MLPACLRICFHNLPEVYSVYDVYVTCCRRCSFVSLQCGGPNTPVCLFNAFFLIQAGTKNLGVLINAFFGPGNFLGCVASLLVLVNFKAATT